MTPNDIVVGRWGARFRGRRFPCSIGKGGIVRDKREGDGGTPVGVWRLIGAGYRADRTPPPWAGRGVVRLAQITPTDIWSDDPEDPRYNHGLRARNHAYSHERLRRSDPQYDLLFATDYNWPDATPHRGSAIFVHVWRAPRHGTAGCVAFRRDHLVWIARRLRPESRLIIQS